MTVRPVSEMGARVTQGKLPSPPDPAPDGPAEQDKQRRDVGCAGEREPPSRQADSDHAGDGQSVKPERGGRRHGQQRPGDPAVIPELPYGEQYAHGHPDEVDVTVVSVAAQGDVGQHEGPRGHDQHPGNGHPGDPAGRGVGMSGAKLAGRHEPIIAPPGTRRYRDVVAEADVVVWYNPRCSKCRGAEELLAAHGVAAQRVFYLDHPPARAEIVRVLALLGADDPRALMRTAEPRYRELGLGTADADALIDAMTRYPELIQRPVVIWPDRAVVARPPELLLPLLEAGPGQRPQPS